MIQTLPVFAASAFRAVSGANEGDGIGPAEDLVLDDIYALQDGTAARLLSFQANRMPPFNIAQNSDTGQAGSDLYLDCVLTFMTRAGRTVDALVLVEVDDAGAVAAIYLHPFADVTAKEELTLVGIDYDAALRKFAQMACVSFTAGTHITMATGAQKKVEDLTVGDRVLTRDAGPQLIRWLGHVTLRATGDAAPVRIAAGAMNNINDLVVHPDHRLFVYQRQDALNLGRAEVLVRARHLLDGTSVTRDAGGHIDYYQMLFDHHQLVFAEGIAVESMRVDTHNAAALPEDLAEDLDALLPNHRKTAQDDLEVDAETLRGTAAADKLRRASEG